MARAATAQPAASRAASPAPDDVDEVLPAACETLQNGSTKEHYD